MRRKIVIVFLSLMLAGCNSILESTVYTPPASLEDHLNIELSNVDNSQNQYLLGLVITNMSTDRIWFPIGMNGAYSYFDPKNEKWVPVKDIMKVISLRPQIILEPQGISLMTISLILSHLTYQTNYFSPIMKFNLE